MTGEVAMALPDYEQWLEQNGASGSMAEEGGILFMRYGCSGCHGGNGIGGAQAASAVQAPPLTGLYGGPVPLEDGTIVTADEKLHPRLHSIAGEATGRGLSANHALVRRTSQRGGHSEACRLYQVPRVGGAAMSAIVADTTKHAKSYLTDGTTFEAGC